MTTKQYTELLKGMADFEAHVQSQIDAKKVQLQTENPDAEILDQGIGYYGGRFFAEFIVCKVDSEEFVNRSLDPIT